MKNVTRVVVFLYLVLSAGCATLKTEEHEYLYFEFEPGWKAGHNTEIANQYSFTEFIREGDDINNWRELVTIQNFNRKSWQGGDSPEDSLNGLKAIREKQCPGVTKWNVIEKNENSILYEWQARPCLSWPSQHEIAKIIYGKYNRFIVHYVAKVYELSPDTRAKWIQRFTESKTILRRQ
ncbi:hypothetical protein SAMN05216419_100234 [Nitrosomonas cryotolerans]|uniref:Lipoprotein n=1 Tax=Nitrosomonas cryotolerans ATCC 49181 TaxID=1131553 RepID=A0A1N6GR29_9PROT|nr:hypothetical protein SAMN05216419_100234 [Nitrosomonas cryotolerans]SIO10006.1 hypothetical protein SAMN02743940_0826 [Nitrosomonas cryotolerans ATCC 49181]